MDIKQKRIGETEDIIGYVLRVYAAQCLQVLGQRQSGEVGGGWIVAKAAFWPTKEIRKKYTRSAHEQVVKNSLKNGQTFFPTNQDPANTVEIADLHSENFHFCVFVFMDSRFTDVQIPGFPDFMIPGFPDFMIPGFPDGQQADDFNVTMICAKVCGLRRQLQ